MTGFVTVPSEKKNIYIYIISQNLKTVCKTQIIYCSLKFCLIFFLDIEIGSLSSIIYSVYSQYKLCLNQNFHLLWLSCLHMVRRQFLLKKPHFFPFQGILSSGKSITSTCGVLSSFFSSLIQAKRYVLAIPQFKIPFPRFYRGFCHS